MNTQPIQKPRGTIPIHLGTSLLLGIAALFILVGAIPLLLISPTETLTPLHLLALVVGWGLSWGLTFVLLRARIPQADLLFLPLTALLTGWGLLLQARLAPSFLLRQIVWEFIGCGVLCAVALYGALPRLLRRYRYTLLISGMLLLGATFVFGVNPSGFGQPLWLGAFGIYFQPSEPLKLLLVIYLASYLSERRDLLQQSATKRAQWLAVVGPMLTMFGLALLLLGWQQDLGAALLFYLTFVAMLYLAWGKISYVALSILLFIPIAIVGTLLSSRVALRVNIWLNPWGPEQADRAFQILQSLFALASGGIAGQGLGQGYPTLIPAVHTDFVYAALVEEFGLVGAIGLIIIFGILIYRGILLSQRSESPFESMLAGGIVAWFAIQMWVIIAGNTKLIPITGVTLPFLSYGGSSLLTMLTTIGLLLNISSPHPATLSLSLPSISQAPSLRKTSRRLGRALLLLLLTPAISTGVWAILRRDTLQDYVSNPRRIIAETKIRRGKIQDRAGNTLADIEIDSEGFVTRTYPVVEAAPALGYATIQYGTSGIEEACDARLRGEIDRTPDQIAWDTILHRPPQGRDVRLTLDQGLQKSTQTLLETFNGATVLIDTRTGEILALGSTPTYNPALVTEDWTRLREDARSPLLNRATQGLAQPGAILETVILASMWDQGDPPPLTDPMTTSVSINGSDLTCARQPSEDTWAAALAAACPAPFAKLGSTLQSGELTQIFTRWGLTEAPDLELPTVAADWPSETIVIRREILGQGDLLVTPLHMVNVAAVLGNNGLRVPLHILQSELRGCTSPDESTPTQVISLETAKAIRNQWPRYGQAIGHLGTALAGPDRTLSWFIGLNSPKVPRYAIAVLLENPDDPLAAMMIGTQLLEQVMD